LPDALTPLYEIRSSNPRDSDAQYQPELIVRKIAQVSESCPSALYYRKMSKVERMGKSWRVSSTHKGSETGSSIGLSSR
jgi:hypothetical protein